MLQIMETLGGDRHQTLKLLIDRRQYRKALEMTLSMGTLRSPLCDDKVLLQLASRGDLVRPFAEEIINLMAGTKRFQELSILKAQLDV